MTARSFLEAMGEVADRYYVEAAAYEADPSKIRRRRVLRFIVRAAVAAVLIAALTVTAYAIYQAALRDYFLDPVPSGTTQPAGELSAPSVRLSWVGYQGTPEYGALREWLAWQQAHPVENYFAPDGSDDNADYEWPDYHILYGAYYAEQGQALDAILDKYGLKPHANAASASAEELYDALRTEPLLSGAYSGSGYLYDDGTVNLQVYNAEDELELTLFAGVKGTLTDIHGFSSPVYDEWSYTVPSGQTVDLAIDSKGIGTLLFETDGAYILARASHDFPGLSPMTKDELEAVADSVNFAALSTRFDGNAHPETARRVVALQEKMTDAGANDAAPSVAPEADEDYSMSVSDENIQNDIMENLGCYTFSGLPDDFTDTLCGSRTEQVYHNTTSKYDSVSGWYTEETREYRLKYARFSDWDLTADEYLELIRRTVLWSVSGSVGDCKVNGYDALIWNEGNGYSVYWYDTEAQLLFIASLYTSPHGGEPVTEEEAVSTAESVIKVS